MLRTAPLPPAGVRLPQDQQERQSLIPPHIQKRDALAEYRAMHGLDKLREALVNEIVKAASFEEGLEVLADHLNQHPEMIRLNKLIFDGELNPRQQVQMAYPDLNADEVSWLALVQQVQTPDTPWIGDVPYQPFYPPSLIGIDPAGLVFGHNVVAIDDHGRILPRTAEELTGVTGNDVGLFHYPFRHNVSQGIQALIMLSLNEGDIFAELKEDESVMAMKQGDSLLLRTFLEFAIDRFGLTPADLQLKLIDIVNATTNNFTRDDIESLRKEAAQYLSECDFLDVNGNRQQIQEVVKVFGMLEKIPSFVEQRTPFCGVVMFYAGTVQFVDLHGRLIDSVPIVEHLRNQFGYRIIDSAHDINLRAEATRTVFSEIDEGIRAANIRLDNKMKLDRLQEELLFTHGIVAPIRATSRIEQPQTFGGYFTQMSAESKYVRRFLKFGAQELGEINAVFRTLPALFTRDVCALRKGVLMSYQAQILLTGSMMEGCYNVAEKSICINVPEIGPEEGQSYSIKLLERLSRSRYRTMGAVSRGNSELRLKIAHNYLHTVVHELAESVVAAADDDLMTLWSMIHDTASSKKQVDPQKLHVSRYGTTSLKEDFCESCAVYVLAGKSFRDLAENSQVLARKYEFLKKLFASDGTSREFENRYPHHIYEIVGDPASPWQTLAQKHFAARLIREESMSDRDLRDLETDRVVSYEDVEEIIGRSEAAGEPISREEATRIALENQRNQDVAEDDLRSLNRIFLFVSDRITAVTLEYGVSSSHVDYNIDRVINALIDGNAKSLRGLLRTPRDKPVSLKHAQEIVDKLRPLVKAHATAIDEYQNRYAQGLDPEAMGNFNEVLAQLAAEMRRNNS
jgi:hypothetical protein